MTIVNGWLDWAYRNRGDGGRAGTSREGDGMSKEAREAIESRLALMRYRIAHGWPRKPIAVIIEEGEA